MGCYQNSWTSLVELVLKKKKKPTCQCRRHKRCKFHPLVREDALEEGMATHSSIPAWRISWTEEPGGLTSLGLQRIGHDWSNWIHTHRFLIGTEIIFLQFWRPKTPNQDISRNRGAWWAMVHRIAKRAGCDWINLACTPTFLAQGTGFVEDNFS